ncbi:MAG: RES family NAD+ phosphorylase [Gemmatimonadaceae bacterium]
MITAWRLVKTRYADSAFTGEGARLYGSRWNSPGVSVAYASDSPALAVLEVLVHLQASQFLPSYSFVTVSFLQSLVETVPARDLPAAWQRSPAPLEVQAIGDAWAAEQRSAVLRVPSALLAPASNYIPNPAHPDFGSVRIGSPEPFQFDPRLIRLP